MFHKSLVNTIKKSIKSKAKVTFNDQQSFFNQVDIDTIPSIIKQKIEANHKTLPQIIKLKTNPHGWIITFYLSFINMYFTDKQSFRQNIQKMYDLLDEDEFKFFRTQNKLSYCYTQWTNSKIKRIIAEQMKDIIQGKYKTVIEIFEKNPQLNKLMFLFCASVLYYCEKIENYQQVVDLQTVKDTLYEYFDIAVNVSQMGVVTIGDGQVIVHLFHRTDLYMIIDQYQSQLFHQQQQNQQQSTSISNEDINTNDSIRLSNLSSIDSQPYDMKLEIVNNHCFVNKFTTKKNKQNFNDLTNKKCNIHQYNSSINTYKVNNQNKQQNGDNLECSFLNDQYYNDNKQNHQQQQRLSPTSNQSCKNKIILSTQGTQWTCNNNKRQQQEQLQIEKLFQKKSHQATTQKSIYDDQQQGQIQQDQYSFIDDNVPSTTRKNTQRKTIIRMTQQSQAVKQNQTLMNKWYEFIRERRNKTKNVQNNIKNDQKPQQKTTSNLHQRLQNSAKKILVQHTRLTLTQKPDFKKIKSRRRNTQKSQSQQKQLTSTNFLKSMKSQTNFVIQSNTNITNPTFSLQITKPPRLSVQDQPTKYSQEIKGQKYRDSLMTPNRISVNDNNISYLKEFKVTQQFTDSVILDQINEKNQTNIKLMKQKARKQRDSIGFKAKQRKTVK